MALPQIRGRIRRRILVNYRADPDVVQRYLPPQFTPRLHGGFAIVGVCLIRLEQIRPVGVPAQLGLASENVAQRIAVTWTEGGDQKQGVFIPRRDTDSLLNHLVGGRLFPGVHHRATFDVCETPDELSLSVRSRDKQVRIDIQATVATSLPEGTIFSSLECASKFFEEGKLGYSPTTNCCRFDGVRLQTDRWMVSPLHVSQASCSYFDDDGSFPPGAVTFDHALLMRDIPHRWISEPSIVT